ncbi:uncharacterized protein [Diadema antillarum]|uniref:uncharacterized protein n=1 Tax=Diadema antillarum TaxID=105358 RepID=UPI003A86FB14
MMAESHSNPLMYTVGKRRSEMPSSQGDLPKLIENRLGLERAINSAHAGKEIKAKSVIHFGSFCRAIISQDWSDNVKIVFKHLDFPSIIFQNREFCGDVDGLRRVTEALSYLFKYATNLLTPTDSTNWRVISYDNSVYKTKVQFLKGHKDILVLLGYTKNMPYGLSFPDPSLHPDAVKVAQVAADLAIAYFEVELTATGPHPFPQRMVQFALGSPPVAGYLIPQREASDTVNSDRISPRTFQSLPGYTQEKFSIQSPPKMGSQSPLWNQGNISSRNEEQFNHEGKPFKESPNERSPEFLTPPSSPTNLKREVELKTCVLCKTNPGNMQCEVCSQARCENCDTQWHKHPTRRSHTRHKISGKPPSPVTVPSPLPAGLLDIARQQLVNNAQAAARAFPIGSPEVTSPHAVVGSTNLGLSSTEAVNCARSCVSERAFRGINTYAHFPLPLIREYTLCWKTAEYIIRPVTVKQFFFFIFYFKQVDSPIQPDLDSNVQPDSIACSGETFSSEEYDVRAPPHDSYSRPMVSSAVRPTPAASNTTPLPQISGQRQQFVPLSTPLPTVAPAGRAGEDPASARAAQLRASLEERINMIRAQDFVVMEEVNSLRELLARESDNSRRQELAREEAKKWEEHLTLQRQQGSLEDQLAAATGQQNPRRGVFQEPQALPGGGEQARRSRPQPATTAMTQSTQENVTNSASASPQSPSTDSEEGWTCEHCTFINADTNTNICSVCHKTSSRVPKNPPPVKPKEQAQPVGVNTKEKEVHTTQPARRMSGAEYFQQLEAEMIAQKRQAKEGYQNQGESAQAESPKTERKKDASKSSPLLSDLDLSTVTEALSYSDRLVQLGLKLGFSRHEVDKFSWGNTQQGRSGRGTFEMLRMWRDRVPRANQRRLLYQALGDCQLQYVTEQLQYDAQGKPSPMGAITTPPYFKFDMHEALKPHQTDQQNFHFGRANVAHRELKAIYHGLMLVIGDAFCPQNELPERRGQQKDPYQRVKAAANEPRNSSEESGYGSSGSVSDRMLVEIAAEIPRGKLFEIGVKLGLEVAVVNQFHRRHERDQDGDGALEMLLLWRQRVRPDEERRRLCEILEDTGPAAAAAILKERQQQVTPGVPGQAGLSEEVLHHLADRISAEDVPMLGLYLGFDEDRIDRYTKDNGYGTQRLLLDWKNKTQGQDQSRELGKILEELGLAHLLEDQAEPRDTSPLSDVELLSLADHLTRQDILQLGFCLGFSRADLMTLSHMPGHDVISKGYQMLAHWRDRNPGHAQRHLLAGALRESGLAGLVEHIRRPGAAASAKEMLPSMGQAALDFQPHLRLTSLHSGSPSSSSSDGMTDLSRGSSISDLSYINDETKKLYEDMCTGSLQRVAMLREAETRNIPVERVLCAMALMGRDSEGTDPLEWMQFHWAEHVEGIADRATKELREHLQVDVDERIIGVVRVSREAAERCLDSCGVNLDRLHDAVRECVQGSKEKMLEILGMGYSTEDIIAVLQTAQVRGDVELAMDALQAKTMSEFTDRIWTKSDGNEDEFFQQIIKNDERSIRMVMVEYQMRSWGRAQTAVKLTQQTRHELADIILAAEECGDFHRSREFLEQECALCTADLPRNKLMTLIHCQCMLCSECVTQHFEIIARDKSIMKGRCPACDQPDLDDPAVAADYFQFLDMLLRDMLSEEVLALFQRKLRDWNLMQDPYFCWCAHCNSGFINGAPERRKMRCPECDKLTCFKCKKQWLEQHEGISCEAFQQWKENNDPDMQARGLAAHLNENGIECPRCKMRYELAKGGCMHFKCPQCTYEFCCGCNQAMKKGESCMKFASCSRKGLHAHHPRDCLFYMRDLDVAHLKRLLETHNVEFNTEPPEGADTNADNLCGVMEQKENPDGLEDAKCGRKVSPGNAGLCRLHYKEYLVGLINAKSIDPAFVYNIDELKAALGREEIAAPQQREGETDRSYRSRLLQFEYVQDDFSQ